MPLRLTCVVSGDMDKITGRARDRIAAAATSAMRDAANQLKVKGRAAIASGGLSIRFQNAFQVKAYPAGGGTSLSPAVSAFHANLPLQGRGKRWTPKDFAATVGPLRSGKHGSKPILFGQVAVGPAGGVLALPSHGIRARKVYAKAKKKWLPVFVGVSNVTDPKKFDLYAVARDVASGIGETILKNMERD
jgi:hypothetical protein